MQQEMGPPLVYLDTPEIAELYANHVRFVAVEAGVVRVELCVDRLGGGEPLQHRYPAVRFALPVAIANDLISKLQQVLAMGKQGTQPQTKQ